MKCYIDKSVWDEALDRIRFLYDNEKNILVNSSGGKDSTVVMELAIIVAKEKGRLPVDVCFCDQESEYQSTIDYFRKLKQRKEINLHWFQVPFNLNNATTMDDNNLWMRCWNEEEKNKWMRERELDAIETLDNLAEGEELDFYQVCDRMGDYVFGSNNRWISLTGIRAQESFRRYILMNKEKPVYQNVSWCSRGWRENVFRSYPIYDWEVSDIWKAISNNKWLYNEMYNKMFQLGVPISNMRVSSIIHETGIHGLKYLKEAEPKTFGRLTSRIGGINTYNQLFKKNLYAVKKLPEMFYSWIEYRDYLINTIVSPKNKELFFKAFRKHTTEEDAKQDVQTILLNDICLTKNANFEANKVCAKRILKKEKLTK